MFETDLHAHSLFSGCGLHSIIEMLTRAAEAGLKAQAITDHGPFLGRRSSSTFFERLDNPVPGIKLLKGMECNVISEDGEIDVVRKYMKWFDVLLLGFHNFEKRDEKPEYYSSLIINAVKKNPCIDIIVHPNAPHYLMDFRLIAKYAAESGIAVELNNAKIKYGRSSREQAVELIRACKDAGCDVAVSTDAHALGEVGDHTIIEELLDYTDFPYEKIINRTLDSTLEWVEKRRSNRIDNY